MSLFLKFCVIFLFCNVTYAWNNDDLEIFDLVEEIKENFYELLGVNQQSTLPEIKKAFRNLSIILHPDKNNAEDANIKFRNLVSVYEVLKDAGKREKYDKVLKEGLPNWKSALYYYRHVRKMGLAEMFAILFFIITIGQYLVAWAAYAEKKFTTEQLLGEKIKKLQKKNKTNVDIDEILSKIPTPSIKNTLPLQIPVLIYRLITETPKAIRNGYSMYKENQLKKIEQLQIEKEEEEFIKKLTEEKTKEKENRQLRRRNQAFKAPEKTDEEIAEYKKSIIENNAVEEKKTQKEKPLTGGLWTDDDLNELVRLTKKYPGGQTDRWEIISEAMNRNVSEVTFMAAKLKVPTNIVHNSVMADKGAVTIDKKSNKIKSTDKTSAALLVTESNWTQVQQQALEAAITKFPKSTAGDRWQKISSCVPNKTKTECILRYKYLAELIQKQSSAKNETETKTEAISEDQAPDPVPSSPVKEEEEEVEEPAAKEVTNKGKPKNKRRERKKNIEYYSVEDEEEEEGDEDSAHP